MDKDNLLGILQTCNLSRRESLVYLKFWELGSAPIAPVARHLDMNRVTVYSIVKKMNKMGIVSSVLKNGTAYYTVVSPIVLQKNLERNAESFLNSLPEFLALGSSLGTQAKVQYYEGIQGLKAVYNDVVESGDSLVRMFMGVKYMNLDFKKYIDEEFVPARIRKGILARVIAPRSDDMDDYSLLDKKSHREMVLVDEEDFDFTNEIIVYGDNKIAIAMFSSEEMSAMIITSNNMYKSIRSIFDLLYKSLTK